MRILFYTDSAFAVSETFIQNQIGSPFPFERIIVYNKKGEQNHQIFSTCKAYKIELTPQTLIDRCFSFIDRFIRRSGEYSFPISTQQKIISIIRENNINIIHCNYGQNAIKFIPIIKQTKTALICHFHGFDSSQLLNSSIYVRNIKKVFRLVNTTITVSNDMTKRLEGYGLEPKKNRLIHYGTDLAKIKTIKKEKATGGKIIILHAGRLTEKKGVPDLISVFAKVFHKYKNLELRIIGSGEEEEKVRNKVCELGISNVVQLQGSRPHDYVLKEMKQADIYILNSRTAENGDMEGYPNTIIEAMACGCAVVSTIHAGIPDAITNELDGLLIPERDNRALEIAIERLIADPLLRNKIQKNALEKANYFSVELMQNSYFNVYQEISQLTN